MSKKKRLYFKFPLLDDKMEIYQMYLLSWPNWRQAASFDDQPLMGIENIISEDLYNEITYASN